MANLIRIRKLGNQLLAQFDDGTSQIAYPTPSGLWILSEPPKPAPPPGGGGTTPPPSGARFAMPFPLSQVTSEYGQRWGRLHAGLDFGRGSSNVAGTAIPCAGPGTVAISTESHSGYGVSVVVDHGGGRHTLYAHMSYGSRTVKVGDKVVKGQKLGGIGQTGQSQGNHLHFETHEGGYRWNASARDPRLMIPKWNK